ncbi:hypothetical protein CFIMG_008071RA00001 [Ceratocystis fimbriata CBS 114723]|uniref:Uncharacterized protein n=1 Tax=Ceratocystis fimbriata CBS 114723 TaxID=1035309 RepID=A0A2C5X9Q9_9PEZI|nr:hypothetical protein CFIMG_008071RA00001 [Ceratocystis fimbriata CBS 114723]
MSPAAEASCASAMEAARSPAALVPTRLRGKERGLWRPLAHRSQPFPAQRFGEDSSSWLLDAGCWEFQESLALRIVSIIKGISVRPAMTVMAET